MKNIMIFSFCILYISCNTQKDFKKISNNFVNDIIFDNSFTSKELKSYVLINPNLDEEKRIKLINYTKYLAVEFKKSINRRSSEYHIISHDELKSNFSIKKEYNLKYEDKNNVFYIVSKDEVITHIIFNYEGKIISFFPGIHQGQTNHSPIMLDTFDDF